MHNPRCDHLSQSVVLNDFFQIDTLKSPIQTVCLFARVIGESLKQSHFTEQFSLLRETLQHAHSVRRQVSPYATEQRNV